MTTVSKKNHEYVKSLGADYAIDYKEEDFVKETLAITNGLAVHAVLDTVGRENANKSLEALAFNGQIAFRGEEPELPRCAAGSPFSLSFPQESSVLRSIPPCFQHCFHNQPKNLND
nr:zinc-binding dehydrogenase [Priestia flexa]